MDEYERLKGDAHAKFVETARGLSNSDPSWSQQASEERMANRPARDPGYGSDDYRQDFEALDRTMKSLTDQYGDSSDSWRSNNESQSSPDTYQYQAKDSRIFDGDDNRKVCNSQLDESIEGIGSLFAQGELSPFTDDARQENENDGYSFCYSCSRNIKSGNRVCPYCSARQ